MRRMPAGDPDACPCGSGRAYRACCGLLHAGTPAPDAEALMRSRYSACVLRNVPYLLATWHPSTRPPRLDLDAATQWLGLTVRQCEAVGADGATVEFVARCRIGGRAHRLHETSRFVREHGRWTYVDGEVRGSRSAPVL